MLASLISWKRRLATRLKNDGFCVVWYYDIVVVIAIAVTVYLVKDVVKLFFFCFFFYFHCYRFTVNKDYQCTPYVLKLHIWHDLQPLRLAVACIINKIDKRYVKSMLFSCNEMQHFH